MKRFAVMAAFALAVQSCVLSVPSPIGSSPVLAQGVKLKRLLPRERLRKPVHLAAVPDGTGRMAVVEQAGRIKIFHPDAPKAEGLLLNLGRRVSAAGWEEGLLSVAFHPDFARNRLYFVYYSAARPRRSVLARFKAAPFALRTSVASERIVLEVPQPYGNHNGGQIAFGPEGYLYIGLGDGGSGGDPFGHGQNRRTLLGTILRIDVNRWSARRGYAIPPDNPFTASRGGSRPEIWAYGLRNPWRYSFDLQDGRIYAGDVGQNTVEEIDLIVKGGNYGWNRMEGTRCYAPPRGCARGGLELPISEYGRGIGQSVTGGFVYRGRVLSGLRGRYVFGDFGSGTVWSIPAGPGPTRPPTPLLETGLAISTFGQDSTGELYLADLNGAIYKLVPGR
ncbi:MAG: PQQ-dependent sugar dehydrogenase [SAR324 cluster bacterium]|nr:PQQ-dependent sugar dehydrogenase [SAR324 cluster bacterium]